MPYIIAAVLIALVAGALLIFRAPADTETTPTTTEEPVATTTTDTTTETSSTTDMTEDMSNEDTVDTEPVTDATEPTDTTETISGTATYLTPRRDEHEIGVTLSLDGNTITAVDVTYNEGEAETPQHISFDAAYEAAVIGQDINTIELSRVGGASLTSDAFNDAVAEIRAQL